MHTNFWVRLLIGVCDFCQIISKSSTQMLPLSCGAVQNNLFFSFLCMATEHNYSPSGLSPLWSGVFRSPMHIPQAVVFYFRKNQHLFWLNFPIHFSSRIQMGFLFSSSLSSFTTLGEKIPPKFNLCLPLPF